MRRPSFRATLGTRPFVGNRRVLGLCVQPLEERLALTVLPAGFSETLVNSQAGLSSPTAMEFSPTGQLFVLEQTGAAKLVRSDGTTHTAATLTVDPSGERGLLGIAFDPSYDGAGPNTDFVYLYYTVPRANAADPANNQLSRYTVTGAGTNTPTFTAGTIIRDLPPEDEDNNPATDGDTNHNGGAIHFGADGKLYVAVGDHNYDTTPQTNHPSQRTDTPFGKILRLNPNGTNPSDTPNPFYTGSATDWQGAIWAMGLRNPYTFAFGAGGQMFINDVGEGTWEEINEGEAAANYGWAGSTSPLWEGFEPTAPWTNYRDPEMAYDHSGATLPSPASAAITGGAFYPAGGPFGSAYAGKYFYADFGGNYIRLFDPANPGSSGTPDTSTAFASSLTAGSPVDLKVDSQGNLYYLSRGGGGAVFRISTTQVVDRHVFYNQSTFDGNSAAINSSDDAAIAPDKSPLLPGAGQAVLANITSYKRGINGIMIDLSVGVNHTAINVNDFVFKVGANNSPNLWGNAPAPSAISVRAGAGVSGSDRVEITWANGAIANTYLEVQVLATTSTGLAAPDVFFWGNLVGETASSTPAGDFARTAAADGGAILAAGTQLNVGITNTLDVNKSNSITVAADRGPIIAAGTGSLARISIASAGPFAPEGGNELGGGDAGIASALAASRLDSTIGPVAVAPLQASLPDSSADAQPLIDISRQLRQAAAASYFASLNVASDEGVEVAVDDALAHELAAGLVAD